MVELPSGLTEDGVRERLTARLSELASQSTVAAEARKPVMLDQQSVGRLSRQDALQQQAMATAQQGRRDQEAHRIRDALKRLAAGDYGWCQICGEPIAVRRLEIDPLALVCVGCAQ